MTVDMVQLQDVVTQAIEGTYEDLYMNIKKNKDEKERLRLLTILDTVEVVERQLRVAVDEVLEVYS